MSGEPGDRHRDDRAERWLRPGCPEDHRRARRRRLGAERLEDVHHQRVRRRPGDRRGAHRRLEGRQGHHAVRRRDRDAGVHPRSQGSTRSARPSPTPPSCSSPTCGCPTRCASARRAWASST
nr:hypothetical protein [Angustibacter aerolatus]